MGLFAKKKINVDPKSMTSGEKTDEIRRLEVERMRINAEIEDILKNYSKLSGNRALRRRRYRMGRSVNDYSTKEKIL